MKNTLIFSLVLVTLAGCAAPADELRKVPVFGDILGTTADVINTTGNIASLFTPLKADDFCKLKQSNTQVAIDRYLDRGFIFTGKLTNLRDDDEFTTVGIKDGEGNIFAKVYNFDKTIKKGEIVDIQGQIAKANFDEKNISKCHILLDNAKVVKK